MSSWKSAISPGELNLSKTTVAKLTNALVEKQYIIPTEKGASIEEDEKNAALLPERGEKLSDCGHVFSVAPIHRVQPVRHEA